MAASAILNFEKLLQFLYYLTYSHQTCWDVAKLMLNAAVESEMSTRIKFKDGGCHSIEFRKDVAILVLLNRFSPNIMLTSNTGLLVENRQILMLKTI